MFLFESIAMFESQKVLVVEWLEPLLHHSLGWSISETHTHFWRWLEWLEITPFNQRAAHVPGKKTRIYSTSLVPLHLKKCCLKDRNDFSMDPVHRESSWNRFQLAQVPHDKDPRRLSRPSSRTLQFLDSSYLSIYLSIYPILSYSILSYPILQYPILSYPIHLSIYLILSYPILSYPSIYLSIYEHV